MQGALGVDDETALLRGRQLPVPACTWVSVCRASGAARCAGGAAGGPLPGPLGLQAEPAMMPSAALLVPCDFHAWALRGRTTCARAALPRLGTAPVWRCWGGRQRAVPRLRPRAYASRIRGSPERSSSRLEQSGLAAGNRSAAARMAAEPEQLLCGRAQRPPLGARRPAKERERNQCPLRPEPHITPAAVLMLLPFGSIDSDGGSSRQPPDAAAAAGSANRRSCSCRVHKEAAKEISGRHVHDPRTAGAAGRLLRL